MESILKNATEILLLLFLIITFLQSGIDKVFDWRGNLTWLKSHFEGTPLTGLVPFLLFTVLLVEMIAAILCLVGLYQLTVLGKSSIAFYGAIMSCVSLLMLLFGQRMAKDYEGAKTIAVYFVPAIFLVYLLQG
ncbi:DoxX family protein [Aggregatimonas sangjinii]|uniref:DoxX family protein n=1 Tax=Aggregatimonas sangjinii TaxID=2583587 RepID=A0A5B7SX82_9FLAO|nr:DoxX family protein [Aggregatimonas sangjinii]QCX01879.1 DoxX family protein [Aggregatimonas sangjinii]